MFAAHLGALGPATERGSTPEKVASGFGGLASTLKSSQNLSGSPGWILRKPYLPANINTGKEV